MKKTFLLRVPDKEDVRVVEAIKVTVAKYVKRERRKTLPDGVDFWDFRCKVGLDSQTAAGTHLTGVPKAIDAVALAGGDEVYVEVLACPEHRAKKPPYQREES
ncbi:MAG: hypothetical protein D4R65_07895 [Verrucomicrobiaceae bacterium]|nr:MAG: hypothetical protein D4R65_07895 [Verrucomicrobiaceae bacterium]